MANVNELAAALQSKGATPQCVSCGRNPNWSTAESLLQIAPDASGGLSIGQGIPALTMICDHCGFVRMHASKLLIP